MDNQDNQIDTALRIAELEKEVRGLRRKLSLSESNLYRSRLVSDAQERVSVLLNTSLKKEIQFFQLVLENSINILLLLDFDGRFAYVSRTFLDKVGLHNAGMLNGRQFDEVLSPVVSTEVLNKLLDAINVATQGKSTVNIEVELDFNHKGEPRTYSVLVTLMTDDEGKSTGIMLLFNDITEINNALASANKASLAKSNFLANMSHEIRTPLNAVIGMSAIAAGSSDLEKINYCLEKINDSSKHLLGVINDILDMSKIETDHFELSFSEFVFEKMLLRIVDVMRFKLEEKRINFSFDCAPDLPYAILSDEQRLSQVIMNLLSNAVKFTPNDGNITVRVGVEDRNGDEFTLRFSIKDSGIGISDEQKPRLFKAFSQADSSISRKFGGTGLGLVISKSIVEKLGGSITFESETGKGTNFIFTIKTTARKIMPIAKIGRKEVSILAVDDMPDVRQSFSIYADKLDVPCEVAVSAADALNKISQNDYNIVFVDWKMPGMDGLDLAKKLTAAAPDKMVVIMISSADWSEIEEDAKKAGVKEFVSKPILLPIIENILDKYCVDKKDGDAAVLDDFSSKTMLLVDDVEINREIIISLLEDTGIRIVCAENGLEAVETFTASPRGFDLIFMDIQMPEMDGYEATKRIRAVEKRLLSGDTVCPNSCSIIGHSGGCGVTNLDENCEKPGVGDSGMIVADNDYVAVNDGEYQPVPIVAMTANVFKEDVERCLDSGMNDHIGKPVNLDEIFSKIRAWTKKRQKDRV